MPTFELNKDNLQNSIDENELLFIDFWAPWCQPCRGFGPVFEEASKENPDAAFAKCNTQDHPEVAAQFGVQSIPTIVVFREQILIYSQPGALQAEGFKELIQRIKEIDMEEVRKEKEKT
jgi:thioredoxin